MVRTAPMPNRMAADVAFHDMRTRSTPSNASKASWSPDGAPTSFASVARSAPCPHVMESYVGRHPVWHWRRSHHASARCPPDNVRREIFSLPREILSEGAGDSYVHP